MKYKERWSRMKRSRIDGVIEEALEFASQHSFPLPGFASWSREEWAIKQADLPSTMSRGLGWDVTDFGRGDFDRYGLCLCTLRNGTLAERDQGRGQTYAEKFMKVAVGQETPFHLHRHKTEDIINRGGGTLRIELFASDGLRLVKEDIRTLVDGVETTLTAGSPYAVEPGESIQVPAGVFHRFWAEGAPVLAVEVSSVNDDDNDNTFLEPFPRYAAIEEDANARFLLVSEYGNPLVPLARQTFPPISDR